MRVAGQRLARRLKRCRLTARQRLDLLRKNTATVLNSTSVSSVFSPVWRSRSLMGIGAMIRIAREPLRDAVPEREPLLEAGDERRAAIGLQRDQQLVGQRSTWPARCWNARGPSAASPPSSAAARPRAAAARGPVGGARPARPLTIALGLGHDGAPSISGPPVAGLCRPPRTHGRVRNWGGQAHDGVRASPGVPTHLCSLTCTRWCYDVGHDSQAP